MFLVLFVAALRMITSIDDSDGKGEGGGDRAKYSCFTILSRKYVFFSILVRIKFATWRAKQCYFRTRSLKVSMNVRHVAKVFKSRSNMSSSAIPWAIPVENVLKNKTRSSLSLRGILYNQSGLHKKVRLLQN